ncbi:MAG: hypothetical protein JXR96_02495 [Deltaproteobacteria bacterium]|nr:hypothetical protein [Deltaproteobacteria bacterium]
MKPYCVVFFSILFSFAFSSTVYPQVSSFSTYTFKRDASLKIGYPEGWSVTEEADETGSALSAVVTRSSAPDSEGYIFMIIRFPQNTGLQGSEQFASLAIEQLRSSSLPTLKLEKGYRHAKMEQIHVSELSLDSEGSKFLGRSWSGLMKDQSSEIGLFVLFYGPKTTFGKFNTDQMLAGLIGPMIGGQPMQAQQQQATPSGGKLDQRFFGTWAMHTTVAANTMMQENTYNPDGTFVIRQFMAGRMMSISPYGSASGSQTLHGTWWVQGGKFHLRWKDGKVAIYTFSFAGNFLDMRGVNVKEKLKFRKVTK